MGIGEDASTHPTTLLLQAHRVRTGRLPPFDDQKLIVYQSRIEKK
jgi:hypothetical protein